MLLARGCIGLGAFRGSGGVRVAGTPAVSFRGQTSPFTFKANQAGDTFTSSTKKAAEHSSGQYFFSSHPLLYFLGFNFLMRKNDEQ